MYISRMIFKAPLLLQMFINFLHRALDSPILAFIQLCVDISFLDKYIVLVQFESEWCTRDAWLLQ